MPNNKTIIEHDEILSPEQESSLIKSLSENYETGRDKANQILGKLQMAKSFQKIADIVSLAELIKIKENKLYRSLKGVSIELADGSIIDDIGKWENFCKAIGSSKSTEDENISNAKVLGVEIFESLKKLGLGTQAFRGFRALTLEQREETVESADNIETLKERIEDIIFENSTALAAEKKRADDAEQDVKAVRENSAIKQKELDQAKERDAKRRFSQEPWKHQTLDLAQGMLEARVLIEQGVNQLTDIFKTITSIDSPLDEKATNYCARSIFSEATNVNDLVYTLTSEVSGLLSTNFKADLDAVDVLEELSEVNK